jgi:hypothetical protein
MRQHQKHVQGLEPEGRDGEEVDRHHTLQVIVEESPPSPGWRFSPSNHVFAHTGFADLDAELEQFAVDAGRAPERIVAAHLPNQLADFLRHRWTPGLAMTNFPGPDQPACLAVPGNNSLWLDDDQGRSPITPSFAEPRQSSRSAGVSFGRFTERCRTPIWWRNARISN